MNSLVQQKPEEYIAHLTPHDFLAKVETNEKLTDLYIRAYKIGFHFAWMFTKTKAMEKSKAWHQLLDEIAKSKFFSPDTLEKIQLAWSRGFISGEWFYKMYEFGLEERKREKAEEEAAYSVEYHKEQAERNKAKTYYFDKYNETHKFLNTAYQRGQQAYKEGKINDYRGDALFAENLATLESCYKAMEYQYQSGRNLSDVINIAIKNWKHGWKNARIEHSVYTINVIGFKDGWNKFKQGWILFYLLGLRKIQSFLNKF